MEGALLKIEGFYLISFTVTYRAGLACFDFN